MPAQMCVNSLVFYLRDCGDSDVHERAAKLSSTYLIDNSLADELILFTHFVQNETSPAQLLQLLERN